MIYVIYFKLHILDFKSILAEATPLPKNFSPTFKKCYLEKRTKNDTPSIKNCKFFTLDEARLLTVKGNKQL